MDLDPQDMDIDDELDEGDYSEGMGDEDGMEDMEGEGFEGIPE